MTSPADAARPVNVDAVRSARFPVSPEGFDRDAVNAFVARVADALAGQRDRIAALGGELDTARGDATHWAGQVAEAQADQALAAVRLGEAERECARLREGRGAEADTDAAALRAQVEAMQAALDATHQAAIAAEAARAEAEAERAAVAEAELARLKAELAALRGG